MLRTAIVKIWGKTVGAILWDEQQQLAVFEYENSFLDLGWDLSPIMLPINTSRRVFSFPELRRQRNNEFDTFRGLPGLIADALPDKYGNQLINTWLAQQGRKADSVNPVELLCFLGSRSMGALEFEPANLARKQSSFTLEMDSLVDIARKMLSQKEGFVSNIDASEASAIKELISIGTSAGGARPKAVIAYNKETGEVRSGQAKVSKGFEHWLLKLDGVSDVQLGDTEGYGRVEMAYYYMALDCGIEMMPSKLLEENGRVHFMTKRFDRGEGNVKHHTQTWCALKHVDFNEVASYSYEQLFQTMRELRLDYQAAEQMFKRMVFNVLARNCDDHTKNFSFLLKKEGKWELAPAYDICYAYRPGSIWVSQHALSINGKREDITLEDFIAVGKSMNIKRAKGIIAEVQETINNWDYFSKKAKVDSEKSTLIKSTLLKVL
ncbi:MAG: toxin HipA [Crocinitomicaceae bacterium]|nr:toxin HipA [Crocinitomicaceae bacterium]|tara:strand:- start:39610 stop:40917 length:1308 start_codon:yes stop_codon:yes gene_type:complete